MYYPLPEPDDQPDNSTWSWTRTREYVFDRDWGICHACGNEIDRAEYECGHIIDRVCGGSDALANVVVMCRTCNQLKPCHETVEQYVAWVDAGGWLADLARLADAKKSIDST